MIAFDALDEAAPPRDNGELVFDEPWQARAFGMCVALLEQNGHDWSVFRSHLVAALDAGDDDAPYYETFVTALEAYAAAV